MMLARQIPFARPWITDEDRAAVLEVLQGHILTHGPQGKAFEEEFSAFAGGGHAVSLSSCMAALHLSYVQMGLRPGDEVIVPAETHVATAHAVELAGGRPVFVDCEAATGNVTPASIEPLLTPKTKAISVVHYMGIPCDMPAIQRLAQKHALKIVEDCAIALGARIGDTHVGLFGDTGTFSFYPVKHITTGEGGMLISRHADVAQRVQGLRAFGVDKSHAERTIPGMYDSPGVGYNYRLGEMAAALGRSQLRRIPENLATRRNHFERLKEGLRGLPDTRILDATRPGFHNSHYALALILERRLARHRNEIVLQLNQAGVGTSVYYPQPVPRMAYYQHKYGYDAARFPNATAISDGGIALPVGPHLQPADLDHMIDTIPRILRSVKP